MPNTLRNSKVHRVGIFVILATLLTVQPTFSQGSTGSSAPYESRVIVDMPTAGVLAKNQMGATVVAAADGALLADVAFAPATNFNVGLGFSGTRVLGTGNPVFQGIPSIHVRYRAVDETLYIPALTIGLQTLGRGVVAQNRFTTNSPGLFLAASKNYTWSLGTLAFHAGLGQSFDINFDGRGFNVWAGMEQSIGSNAGFMAEFNPTINDTHSGALLNIAFRWSIIRGVTLELQARDAFGNLPAAQGITRTLGIEIVRNL